MLKSIFSLRFNMLGRNVPQIVEIEKLRSLPETSFGCTLADFLDSHHLCNHYWGS
ncbi:hypothetical protein [Trichocoleus sp. FACHB-69]|uniref:hypothetical protein n=1 Tax=Trichocoleus sp. FACHB-69 TaxID=2692874 RepID=UPI0016889337|nr:hypothetical protein [Trichocoleus sp. FACHB-69]